MIHFHGVHVFIITTHVLSNAGTDTEVRGTDTEVRGTDWTTCCWGGFLKGSTSEAYQ